MSSQRREIADPDGRVVVLDERIKGHLARRRPQMLEHIPAILDTVARPDAREDDLGPVASASTAATSTRGGGCASS